MKLIKSTSWSILLEDLWWCGAHFKTKFRLLSPLVQIPKNQQARLFQEIIFVGQALLPSSTSTSLRFRPWHCCLLNQQTIHWQGLNVSQQELIHRRWTCYVVAGQNLATSVISRNFPPIPRGFFVKHMKRPFAPWERSTWVPQYKSLMMQNEKLPHMDHDNMQWRGGP